MNLSFGDVLEVLALGCFATAAGIALGLIGALVAAGVCLFYLAQDWSALPIPRPHLPKPHLPALKIHLSDGRRKASE